MNDKNIICIENAVPRLSEFQFTSPINWHINEGEQWAVIGPNGAGKTLLTDILQRKIALKEGTVLLKENASVSQTVKSIAFKDIYSLADYRNSYYQQRFHATETDEMPLVEDLFKEYLGTAILSEMLFFFGINDLLTKRIIFLSSGELRKFLIVRILLSQPKILILDNPFIGLDTKSRDLLLDLLKQISVLRKVQIILLLSNPGDIPEMTTHILPIYNRTLYPAMTREAFLSDKQLISSIFPDFQKKIELPTDSSEIQAYDSTFRLENILIKYNERTILKDMNWEVKKGEKWALLGPNGSGKSTLLSLIFADNPQAYANTIYLFDKKRGSGESIWDIKKRIGYVSPEMHLYYHENVPVIHLVGSGFFDSVGLYRKCNDEQTQIALEWMEIFGISHLKDRLFLSLSSGEQRLALLARAFVKNPDLLILDEPLHGLDVSNKKKIINIIETYSSLPGKTLIYVTHYLHELPRCVDKQMKLEKIENTNLYKEIS